MARASSPMYLGGAAMEPIPALLFTLSTRERFILLTFFRRAYRIFRVVRRRVTRDFATGRSSAELTLPCAAATSNPDWVV